MGASGGTPLCRARGGSGAHMISRIVAFALQQRFITLAMVLVLTAAGIVSFSRLPIEAYPDVADVEVDVITLWPGHAAEEVERHITLQLEKELNGIAGVTFLRSFSNFGLSNVRILFADGTDNYWARQQVQERIAQAEIPADAHPQLGPLASVIGEVYRYTLHAKTMPLVELKALQDWVLERELRSVPGAVREGGKKQHDEMLPVVPAGEEMRPYYSRDRLVSTTVATVMRNLVEGALLLTVLLSLFLYNMLAALIVALVIPLSLLFAFV